MMATNAYDYEYEMQNAVSFEEFSVGFDFK